MHTNTHRHICTQLDTDTYTDTDTHNTSTHKSHTSPRNKDIEHIHIHTDMCKQTQNTHMQSALMPTQIHRNTHTNTHTIQMDAYKITNTQANLT